MKKQGLIAALAAGAVGAAAGGAPVYAAEDAGAPAEEVQEAQQEDVVYESGLTKAEEAACESAEETYAAPEAEETSYGEDYADGGESYDEASMEDGAVYAQEDFSDGQTAEEESYAQDDSFYNEDSSYIIEDSEESGGEFQAQSDGAYEFEPEEDASCEYGEDEYSEDASGWTEDSGESGLDLEAPDDAADDPYAQSAEEISGNENLFVNDYEDGEDTDAEDSGSVMFGDSEAGKDSADEAGFSGDTAAADDGETQETVTETVSLNDLYGEDGQLSDSLVRDASQTVQDVLKTDTVPEASMTMYSSMLRTAFALTQDASAVEDVSVGHTEEEILNYYNQNLKKYHDDRYENPFSFRAQTLKEDGTLTEESKQQFLDVLNFIRWMGGVDPVTEDAQKTEYSQAGVNYLYDNNLSIDHNAAAGDTSEEGKKADVGLTSSNLYEGWSNTNVFDMIFGFFQDDDPYNVGTVGHRRNMMNPSLKTVGIGYRAGDEGSYLALYVQGEDTFAPSKSAVSFSGSVPIEYLKYCSTRDGLSPWCIHLGSYVTPEPGKWSGSDIVITITRDDGKVFTYDKSNLYDNGVFDLKLTTPWFALDDTPYGRSSALLINPYQLCDGNADNLKGHSFTVNVKGLVDRKTKEAVDFHYTTSFYSFAESVENANKPSAETQALINAINGLNTAPDYRDYEAYQSAMDAYAKLSDAEKAKVPNYSALESGYRTAKEDKENYDKAAEVSSLIDAIPNGITLGDRQKVEDAEKAYNALTDAQKKYVENAGAIQNAKDALRALEQAQKTEEENRAAARAAEDAIRAIPETLTLEDAGKVKAADDSYSSLTDAQKAMVGSESLARLNAAKAEIARLEKDAADRTAVARVENAIAAVTDDSSLLSAKDAYNALTPEQQAMVSPDLVSTLNRKLADYEVRENQKREDAEAVRNFEDVLNRIPSDLTLQDAGAVEQARRVYDALTDTQKGMTSDADLLKAEGKIADLRNAYERDLAEADDYSARLSSFISKEMTLEDRSGLDALRKEYESLPDSVKALLPEDAAGMLDRADQVISRLEEEEYLKPVLAVEDLISKIPDSVTLSDRQAVRDAREAYDRLDADRQGKVSSAGRIEEAEREIARLEEEQARREADQKAADAVTSKIEALGGDLSLNDEQAVSQARKAYDSLTDSQKELVSSGALNKLSSAESRIANLKKEMADKAAASQAEQAISSASDDGSLLRARDAYDALTPEQKALVNPDLVRTLNEKLADYEARENQKREDAAAVKNFEDALKAIPSDLTLKDAGAVEQARRVYDALTDTQKAMTSDETLRKAEGEIAALKKAYEEDLLAARTFEEGLSLFDNAELTLNEEPAFNIVKEAFDSLTESQKALLKEGTVSRVNELSQTFDRLRTEEENRRAASDVSKMIEEVPENPTLEDADLVDSVSGRYNSLSDGAKAMVPEELRAKIEKASQSISQQRAEKADREAAEKVQNLIDALPDELGIEDKAAVEEAKKAWDALTDAQKKLVDASGLDEALEIMKAVEIEDWLEGTNGVFSPKDDEKLAEIRDLFESLKDRDLVDPVWQARLADLLSQKEDYDRKKADETSTLVSLLTNRPTVGTAAAAVNSYNGLTGDQKEYVSDGSLAVLRGYADVDEAPETGTGASPLAAAAGAGLLGGTAGLAWILKKKKTS